MSEEIARALLWLGQPLEIWLWADEKQLDQVLDDPNWVPEEDGDAS